LTYLAAAAGPPLVVPCSRECSALTRCSPGVGPAAWRLSCIRFGADSKGSLTNCRAEKVGTWIASSLWGPLPAYGLGVYELIRSSGQWNHLYLEASAVVTYAIRFGKWLEVRASAQTPTTIRCYQCIAAETARVSVAGEEKDIHVVECQCGDKLWCAWRANPVDGAIVRSKKRVDESLIRGESLPVAKAVEIRSDCSILGKGICCFRPPRSARTRCVSHYPSCRVGSSREATTI